VAGTDLPHSENDEAAARLSAAAGSLLNRVGHWTDARWSASAGPGLTRADIVFGLVQYLADLVAAVENREPRNVPRLKNDQALPDQIQVMINDLLRARAAATVLESATAAIEATAAAL
jgi:hypothetical protein